MKRRVVYLFALLLPCLVFLHSCTQEGIGQFDDAVVDNSNSPNKFRQITFTVSLHNTAAGYANIEKIDSLKLRVNGKTWGNFSSETADTTGRTELTVGNIAYSAAKLNYLVIAPYQLAIDTLATAGDYAQYLNQRLVIQPGEYVCEVAEVKFKNALGAWVTLKPRVYKDFTVVANTVSSYAGDIEVRLP